MTNIVITKINLTIFGISYETFWFLNGMKEC